MRRFVMIRDTDVSGVSGEGAVIWGVQWPDGRISYRWNTKTATTVTADSIADVEEVHGHGGATRLVWLDTEVGAAVWELLERRPAAPSAVIPAPARGPVVVASPKRERR